MEERIRQLEREWGANPEDEAALLRYVTALYNTGDYLQTFYLLGEYAPDKIKLFGEKGFPSLLPKDWRTRRDMPPRASRFEIERPGEESGYQIIDWAYTTTFGDYASRREARSDLRWIKEYVRIYGDIDFNAMPYGPDESLHYDSPDLIAKWWLIDYPAKT